MITKEYIDLLRKKHDVEHLSYRMLSRIIETETGEIIPQSTLNDWLNGGWEKRKNNERLTVNESFELDKNLASARAEAKIWKNKYQSVVKNDVFQDRIINDLRNYVQVLKPSPIKPLVSNNQHFGEHHAVLLLSDLHLGEVVDSEQTRGIGQFNMEIASKRLDLLAEKTLELIEIERNGLNITDLHIFGLGDMVSGGKAMHDELNQTNEVNILEQTTVGAFMLSHFIAKLAPHFTVIHKKGVVGNHGRDAKKPYYKDRYVNFDYIMYQLEAMMLQKYSNVEFELTKSFFQIAQVLNTRFLLLHGDGIKGFGGFPWYGVERAVARLHQMLDFTNETFNMVALGHFHEPVNTERFICNGNLKGSEEFCWKPNQKVVMFDGSLKQISDIKEGEYVITGNGNKGLVTKVLCYDVEDRDMTKVFMPSRLQILEGTSNHRVEVMQRIQHSKIFSDYHYEKETERRLDNLGERVGYKKNVASFLRSPKRELIEGGNFDDGFLIGLYLAEGSLAQDDQITFSLSKKEHELIVNLLEKWLVNNKIPNLGGGFRRYVHIKPERNSKNAVGVWLAHKKLYNLIDKWVGFKIHAHEKKLKMMPNEIEFCKGVAFGWLGGDGTLGMENALMADMNKPVIGVSVSENLIYQMRQLFIDLGYSIGISNGTSGYKPGSPQFHLNIRKILSNNNNKVFDDCLGVPVRKIESYRYTGKVYDLTVETDHSYLIQGYAVHNSIGSFFPAVKPSQTLLLVDGKNGIVDIKKIYLDSADNRKDLGLPMGIDSVWAKSIV